MFLRHLRRKTGQVTCFYVKTHVEIIHIHFIICLPNLESEFL